MTNLFPNSKNLDVTELGEHSRSVRIKLGRRFMVTASFSVMSVMLSATAHAQVLPNGCTPSPATDGVQ